MIRDILFRALLPIWVMVVPALLIYMVALVFFPVVVAKLIFYGVCFGLILLMAGYALLIGVPPMPTRLRDEKIMLDMIPENFDGTIYELGSGWGTLAFPVAKAFPGAQVVAIERSPLPHWFARFMALLRRRPNLTFQRQDFFTQNLNAADIIITYLFPGLLDRLGAKLQQESKPGTLLISNSFQLTDFAPIEARAAIPNPSAIEKVYLYRF